MTSATQWLGIGTLAFGLLAGCSSDNGGDVPTPAPLADTSSTSDTTASVDTASPTPDTAAPDMDTASPTTDVEEAECASHDDCNDSIDCTSDVCTIDGKCVNDLANDVCWIADECIATGTVNPTNDCEVCDPTNYPKQWTPRPAIACDDNDPCTATSFCNKGVCTGDSMDACCGNGIVETGETCDGNCPSECLATQACMTVLEWSGSPDTCDVVCTTGPLAECISNDGCCPEGCSNAVDNDCEETCGNGVLETGELCDGNCPTACFNSNPCVEVSLEGDPSTCNSECVVTENTTCGANDGCCPQGCSEATDSDCSAVQCDLDINIQCGIAPGSAAQFKITVLDSEEASGLAPMGYLFFNWGDENIGFDNLLPNWCMNPSGDYNMLAKSGCVVATYEIGTCLPLGYPKTCQTKQCYSCP